MRAGVSAMQNKLFRKVNLDNSEPALIIKELTKDENGNNWERLNLENSNLSEASLKNVNFSNMIAENANFSGADLTGSILYGANLKNAEFDGANLTNVDLRGANLAGANFRNTILSGIIVSGVVGVDNDKNAFDSNRYQTKFVDGDLEAKFNNAIVNVGNNSSTYIRGALEFDPNKESSSDYNVSVGEDVHPEGNWEAVALWPYGLNIEPTDKETETDVNLGINYNAVTIKKVPFINDARNALSKLRGGIPKAGGLDFTDTQHNGYWDWANKIHYRNPFEEMYNINSTKIIKWVPAAYQTFDDWNTITALRNTHRGQWSWNDNSPNYYGFPNVKEYNTGNIQSRIGEVNGEQVILRSV